LHALAWGAGPMLGVALPLVLGTFFEVMWFFAAHDIRSNLATFHFDKPGGFVFKAGQFCDFTLINPGETDAEGNIRGFSLASAPYERDLMFATRMRDTAFKRVLRTLEIGTEVSLDAPYGSFTLHNNPRTASCS
jgi:ferredoxin-NADP reductase